MSWNDAVKLLNESNLSHFGSFWHHYPKTGGFNCVSSDDVSRLASDFKGVFWSPPETNNFSMVEYTSNCATLEFHSCVDVRVNDVVKSCIDNALYTVAKIVQTTRQTTKIELNYIGIETP